MGYSKFGTGNNIDVVLLSNVSSTGRSLDKTINGFKTLTIEVYGTVTSFSLQLEGKSASGNPYALQATNISNLTISSNITSVGLYQIDITGLSSINANLITVTGGNITVQGKAVS